MVLLSLPFPILLLTLWPVQVKLEAKTGEGAAEGGVDETAVVVFSQGETHIVWLPTFASVSPDIDSLLIPLINLHSSLIAVPELEDEDHFDDELRCLVVLVPKEIRRTLEEHPEISEIIEVVEFTNDNRAGISQTLHRNSSIRNRKGEIIGLTFRVGRSVRESAKLLRDLVQDGKSLFLIGPPCVGKTTIIREVARKLGNDYGKRVMIVDTSNEIGGEW